MKIIKISGLLRDGGSIKEIITDKGIFSRVKKINGTNNGYYGAKGKVDDSVAHKLESALNLFFSAKKEIKNIKEIEQLIYQYKEEELPDAESPFHYEAEIWSGMKSFLEWLKNK